MKGLTQKQSEILDYIHNYIQQHQFSPSYRDIMHHFSLSSPGSVYKFIRTLKRKGVLTAEKQCSRSLLPTKPISKESTIVTTELPLIGNITAGTPIEMFIQSQSLAVPTLLVPRPENTYILRTMGDSLVEELISDGDLLLVEARQEAHPGETVIGVINQHETFVKRYYPEGQYVRLQGQTHHPLTLRAESILIQGVLVGLIRAY